MGLSRLIYIDKILIDMNKTVIRTTKTFVIFLVFVSLYGALIAFANQLPHSWLCILPHKHYTDCLHHICFLHCVEVALSQA